MNSGTMKGVMTEPDVYYSRISGRSHDQCLKALLDKCGGHFSEFRDGAIVGIKMTIGDEHSTANIKPELVRLLVDKLKSRSAKPFVFDTNVIYKGQRQNSVDHLNLAYRKGFTPDNIGCPYIIADSVFGTDSHSAKVNFKNLKEIKVPSLIKVMDNLIVLSHITGHIMSGYAASLKNVAMGMASRAGKQIQHSSLKPSINVANCTLCGGCIESCPVSAISENSGKAFINTNLCIGCGECIACCKSEGININWREESNIFAEKKAEYACGILSRIRNKVFMNFAIDITEECDCISGDDPRYINDAGIFLSYDILAADKACYDVLTKKTDHFSRNGRIKAHLHEFRYAQEIGLGRLDYNLIKI